jgi:uncharacterized protein (TIGR02268 family)
MRKATWLALLVSTSVGAQRLPPSVEMPAVRPLYMSKDPTQDVPELHVAGGMVTTLRFENSGAPRQAELLGWEGRFEPLLVGNRSVVLVPLKPLAQGERFMLLVTLMDGTALPFTVTASKDYRDVQVNVYPDPESPEAVRARLEQKHRENEALRDENQRREREETSVDHALAALLAKGESSLTPFRVRQKWTSKDETFQSDVLIMDGGGRAAVVFLAKNLDPQHSWKLEEARLSAWGSGDAKPFALRMTPSEIAPGKSGTIAIVTPMSSFDTPQGTNNLVLELFRHDGLRQGYVVLEPRPQR